MAHARSDICVLVAKFVNISSPPTPTCVTTCVTATRASVVAYDEVEDVLNRHGGHVAELRHACVNGRDVVGACCRGVVLETETRLEATGKELVRNGGTCEGVQEKFFGPSSGTTVRRAW